MVKKQKCKKPTGKRGMAPVAMGVGLIMAVIMMVAVLLPVTQQTVGTQTAVTYATNESLGGVNATTTLFSNTTANDAVCDGDFTWGRVFAYNRSNTTAAYQLLTSGTNYTGYSNGSIAWLSVASADATGDTGNYVNMTYHCFNVAGMDSITSTILGFISLLIAVGALAYIAMIALGGRR